MSKDSQRDQEIISTDNSRLEGNDSLNKQEKEKQEQERLEQERQHQEKLEEQRQEQLDILEELELSLKNIEHSLNKENETHQNIIAPNESEIINAIKECQMQLEITNFFLFTIIVGVVVLLFWKIIYKAFYVLIEKF